MVAGRLHRPELDAFRRGFTAPGLLPDPPRSLPDQHRRQLPPGQPVHLPRGQPLRSRRPDGAARRERSAGFRPRLPGAGQRLPARRRARRHRRRRGHPVPVQAGARAGRRLLVKLRALRPQGGGTGFRGGKRDFRLRRRRLRLALLPRPDASWAQPRLPLGTLRLQPGVRPAGAGSTSRR